MGNHARLAAAGAGKSRKRPFHMRDSLTLWGIQTFKKIHSLFLQWGTAGSRLRTVRRKPASRWEGAFFRIASRILPSASPKSSPLIAITLSMTLFYKDYQFAELGLGRRAGSNIAAPAATHDSHRTLSAPTHQSSAKLARGNCWKPCVGSPRRWEAQRNSVATRRH